MIVPRQSGQGRWRRTAGRWKGVELCQPLVKCCWAIAQGRSIVKFAQSAEPGPRHGRSTHRATDRLLNSTAMAAISTALFLGRMVVTTGPMAGMVTGSRPARGRGWTGLLRASGVAGPTAPTSSVSVAAASTTRCSWRSVRRAIFTRSSRPSGRGMAPRFARRTGTF